MINPIAIYHFKKIFNNQKRVLGVVIIFAFLIEIIFTLILSTSVMKIFIESYYKILPLSARQLTGFLGQNFSGKQFIAFGYNHPAILFILIFIPISISVRYITAEIENRSIELLALRIHPRYRMVITQYVFTLFMLAMVFTAMFCGSLLGKHITGLSEDIDVVLLLKICGTGFLFFSTIAAGVTFIATIKRERSQAMSWSIAIILILFVYDAIIRIWQQAYFLKPYSLFNWYQPVSIAAKEYNFQAGIPLLLGLSGLFIFLSIYSYSRRDL